MVDLTSLNSFSQPTKLLVSFHALKLEHFVDDLEKSVNSLCLFSWLMILFNFVFIYSKILSLKANMISLSSFTIYTYCF